MTRRKFALALVCSAGLAALAAPASAQTPQRGGTLIYAVNAEPPGYDCQATTTFVMLQTVGTHYSRLINFDPDNYPSFKPDVAESWTVAPDGLTLTFKLRGNVKFHDGSLLTAEDVKATFERIRNPPQGIVSVRRAQFEDISAIEAPDPRTVVFKLSKPNSSIMMTIASPWNCLYSAAKLRQDIRFPEKNIMGTGAFRFVDHVAGSHWVGRRFDDYFIPGRPYLDGFRVQFMTGSAMANSFQGGQIMAEFRGLTPAERDKFKAALGPRVVVSETPWNCKFDIFFNTTHKPYDDVRVRRALSLAIDRWHGAEALSRITFVRSVGLTLRPGYPLAMNNEELEKLPGFGRDIAAARAEARRLLKEAGAEGLKFTLINRSVPEPFNPVGVYLIDQWRQIGVSVEHSPLEVGRQKATLLAGNFDVGLDANCYDIDEPNSQLALYVSHDKSPINFNRSNDAVLDELFEKQKRATDEADRLRYVRAFERRLIEQSYSVPVVWWHRIVAHSSQVHGWKILPSHYLNQDLVDVWLAPAG